MIPNYSYSKYGKLKGVKSSILVIVVGIATFPSLAQPLPPTNNYSSHFTNNVMPEVVTNITITWCSRSNRESRIYFTPDLNHPFELLTNINQTTLLEMTNENCFFQVCTAPY